MFKFGCGHTRPEKGRGHKKTTSPKTGGLILTTTNTKKFYSLNRLNPVVADILHR